MSTQAAPALRAPREAVVSPVLAVDDFGPVSRAEVELRPLTVFVGPGNTGKSYLAKLIYALRQGFKSSERGVLEAGRSRLHRFRDSSADWDWSALGRWVARAVSSSKIPALPDASGSLVHGVLRRRLEKDMFTAVTHAFGLTDLGDLMRRPGPGARVDLNAVSAGVGQPLRYSLGVTNDRISAEAGDLSARLQGEWLPTESLPGLRHALAMASAAMHEAQADRGDSRLRYLADQLVETARRRFQQPFGGETHYLPADRSGLVGNFRFLGGTMVRRAARPAPDVVLMSGVVADFLAQLMDLPKRPRALTHLAKRLEDEVLSGSIQCTPNAAEFPDFFYRPDGWDRDLPLPQASAMATELAPLSLYLRYVVRPGDTLLIEEPEAHLHPEVQPRVAQLLAELMHEGVQVVITTHSEWMLEQFANLIRLSALPEAGRRGLAGLALLPEQVGIWLFKPAGQGGSVVEEVVVDEETGLLPVGYDKVGEALYNEGAAIFNRLQEDAERG